MASAVVAVFNFVRNALLFAGGGALGSTLGGTIAATVIAGVVTAGIAVGTARAFGALLAPEIPGIGPNPGTRIQLAPDTGNKIQVVYGDVLTSGPISDANISNQNQTMHYFIVLSEETDSGTFSIGSAGIRFGDKKLTFGTGASAHTVVSTFDANGTSTTNWNGKIRVRVYAGSTQASDQIFPVPGGGVTAVAATTMMPHWTDTTNYAGTGLVFAMVEVDYDAEQGLTNMDAMTFNLVNSLKSPGSVAIDYMTNDRYGAGISNTLIDFDSFTGAGNSSVGGYADELVTYTPNGGGSANIARYEINGTLSTLEDVSTNIDKLMMSCGSYMLFDGKQGKYKGLPNKIYEDQANCFVANDDNIVSSIRIQNTDLYQMYNQVEIEYFDKERRDQRNTVFIEIPTGERNSGEPDNKLSYSIDMINNKVHAEALGNIDLLQTRLDSVIQFTGDHSFLQVDVGDVIKVTNSTYGYTDKLFRVMRIKESEDELGSLTCDIVGLEYADSVYEPVDTTLDLPFANIDLPRIPIIQAIPIPGVFDGTYANLTLDPTTFGNIIVKDTMKVFGAGAQLADSPAANTSVVSGTTFEEIIPVESYDITDSDIGDYEVSASATLGGNITGAYDLGFSTNVKVTWANATAAASTTFTGGGVEITNLPSTTPPPPLVYARKINTDPVANGHPADMTPQTANIVLRGYSTIDTSNTFVRSFGNMNYEMLRVTKGEK